MQRSKVGWPNASSQCQLLLDIFHGRFKFLITHHQWTYLYQMEDHSFVCTGGFRTQCVSGHTHTICQKLGLLHGLVLDACMSLGRKGLPVRPLFPSTYAHLGVCKIKPQPFPRNSKHYIRCILYTWHWDFCSTKKQHTGSCLSVILYRFSEIYTQCQRVTPPFSRNNKAVVFSLSTTFHVHLLQQLEPLHPGVPFSLPYAFVPP